MGLNILLAEVMSIIRRNQSDAKVFSDPSNFNINDAVFWRSMILNLQVKILAKNTLIPGRNITGNIRTAAKNGLGNLTTQTGRGND